ncbi:unnamed protein product [Nippostrongylus brasiliensis]|uniref:Apple domain-containing protein n=1 Tax=Nippostrongylus brasiliensis TaxID=27835 RepID=A0A0N4Y663_NIPBR|nr:unnamed protein product [Nippostrongylus brasiliensis]
MTGFYYDDLGPGFTRDPPFTLDFGTYTLARTMRIFFAIAVLKAANFDFYGDGLLDNCVCPNGNSQEENCYKTNFGFLMRYQSNHKVALDGCDEPCRNDTIRKSYLSEIRRHGSVECAMMHCPCRCTWFCDSKSEFFTKVNCVSNINSGVALCESTTKTDVKSSSTTAEMSTGTSHPQSTIEDHPLSDKAGNDFGSTSSRGTTIHTSRMPSATTSTPASTFVETSLKEEVTDTSTSMTIQTSLETGTTGATATTTTVYGSTEEPFKARTTTSTARADELSTNKARSTSEPDLSLTSESTTSSTLGSTTDSIRTFGTTLPASRSHAATDSTSWSSILFGKWTTTMLGYETTTSSPFYEKPSKTTTTIGDWYTKAPTRTMTTTEASTVLTVLEKTSQTPAKSQREESTYMTSTYKTTTLQDLQTSSEKVTERTTISSSPTAASSQEASPTMIQDFTYRTSTRSDLQASSEASSEPAAAPIYTATPSQGMGTSPTPKLEESTYRTSSYPEQQESSEKASTASSAPSLLTTILSQGRGTSTTQLQKTTTIYQAPQTSTEKISSGPTVLPTHTAIPTQGTPTSTLPEESTSFSTSYTTSLTPGEGPESTAEKRPIISSRITRYYQPSSSSTSTVSDHTDSSTVASSPLGTTIDKASSVTSTSYTEIYRPLTLLSTLLHRGDGNTLIAMDDDAQRTSSAPISEKVPLSNPRTQLPYPWTAETPRISPATSTTPTTPRFASTSQTVKFEGTTLETTALTDEETLEATSPTMKESETTAVKFLYFTNLARTHHGSGSVTTTIAPEEDATIKAGTTEAGQLMDSDEVKASSTLKSGNHTATPSTSYSSRAPPESTTARSWECALPCPLNYMEGPNYCYRSLQNIRSTMNYREAFHLCAVEEKGDMADEVDLRDGLVQQLLRNASRNNEDVQRFFVNERDSKQYMEEKKVRVVSLERSSRFLLYVNETVRPRSYVNNVTAACKRPSTF